MKKKLASFRIADQVTPGEQGVSRVFLNLESAVVE
jgi:hypothetical protein